jgi:hypothetical protein
LFSVIAWPLRFSSQGITIGFTGDPASPIVEASGMPISMCVAWFSPSDSLSRMTPTTLPSRHVEFDAELLEVAELVRHHDRRAVGERDDAEAHRGGFGTSAA